MANGRAAGSAWRELGGIFEGGTASGLADPELIRRFLDRRDESAFAALVARHGPMVLATCRGVLRSSDDAEDAFQATFLVLARKAGTIRGGESLGGWLHRVARRVAVEASVDASRRERRERAAGPRGSEPSGPFDDLIPILHEEIGRLPEKYRAPIVLCDLGAMTRDEAAGQLGWPPGTVAGRLARARKLLRDRLSRRGAAPSALLPAALPKATVPPSWAGSAVRLALQAAGTIAAGATPTAALLAEQILKALSWEKSMKIAVGVVLSIGLAGGSLASYLRDEGPRDDPKPATKKADPPAKVAEDPKPSETVEVRGRVLDPDGRPVPGATVRLEMNIGKVVPDPAERKGTTGTDGHFSFRAARDSFAQMADRGFPVRVVATAPGFGFALAEVGPDPDAPGEPTIRLVRDDLPIEGRLVDLEGRPVAGASIRPIEAGIPKKGDLSDWAVRFKDRDEGVFAGLDQTNVEIPEVKTGADGRFRLLGIGRDRLAMLLVSGPTVETHFAFATTRDVPTIAGKNRNVIGPETFLVHGAKFDHATAPCKPIEGTVRDQDTGKPIAGVKINGMVYSERSMAYHPYVEATTGDDGRYRLLGLAPGDRYRLILSPGDGLPYLATSSVETPGTPALDPATVDLRLKRVVLIRGRVVEKGTGRPVRGSVSYFSYNDNPHVRDFPGFRDSYEPRAWCEEDGRFAIAGLPGPGFLAVRADRDNAYRRGVGAGSIKGMNPRMPFSARPSFVSATNYHSLVGVEPKPGVDLDSVEIAVDPGRTLAGSIVDPDGKPVAGCEVRGAEGPNYWKETRLAGSTFEATCLDPSEPRRIYAFHEGRTLAGSILIKGDEPGPLVLKLQPRGRIVGRVVDDEGRPRTRLRLIQLVEAEFRPDAGVFFGEIALEPDGRFEVPVVPGLSYKTYIGPGSGPLDGILFDDIVVKPGEVRDLGDVKPSRKN